MHSAQDTIYSSTDYHKQKHGASAKASDLITRYRTERFCALIGSQAMDILEVGVGPGWNLVRLPAHRRVGQDVTSIYAGSLREHGVEFASDLSQLSGQKFDVVILSHVLEHLLEPAKMLMRIGPLLKPDGKLLLIVPLESPVRKFSSKDKNHHLASWNAQTLNEFMVASGYMIHSSKVRRAGYDRFAAEAAVGLNGGFGLYKLLLSIFRTIRPCHEIQVVAGCNIGLA